MPTFSLQQKHAQLDQHNAQTLIRIAKETGDTPITPTRVLSLLGDERRRRGHEKILRARKESRMSWPEALVIVACIFAGLIILAAIGKAMGPP